jgi:hypothetical protein
MISRSRTSIFLATVALLAPVLAIAGSAPAGASTVDTSDLMVSATSGAPGDRIEVSSASCVDDDDTGRALLIRLISGTAPDEVLAGAGGAFDGEPGSLVVPDWLDPAHPAVIEAQCEDFDFTTESDTFVDYAPVAFDVLPGAGPSVQSRTYSRTTLLAGQAFSVSGEGCTLPDADYAEAVVFVGADLTGRTWNESVGGGEDDDLKGTSYEVAALLANGGIEIQGSESASGGLTLDQLTEHPTDIPPGDYTVVTDCGNEAGDLLVYEPQIIHVTGSAPIADVDLTMDQTTRKATLAGESCTSGDVEVELDGFSLQDFAGGPSPAVHSTRNSWLRADRLERSAAPKTAGRSISLRRQPSVAVRSGRGARVLDGSAAEGTTVSPAADGSWSAADGVSFDQGWVEGYAVCGDPFADGFVYDPQAAEVKAAALTVETTTSTTTTTTTVPAAPAGGATPVSGSTAFAG